MYTELSSLFLKHPPKKSFIVLAQVSSNFSHFSKEKGAGSFSSLVPRRREGDDPVER